MLVKERERSNGLLLSKWDNPTIGEMIAHETRLRLAGSPSRVKQLQSFREAEESVIGVASELKHMLQKIGHEPSWDVFPEMVSAEIGTLEHEEAQESFQLRHDDLVERVTANFLNDLEQATDTKLVGKIEWLGPRACRFNFFEKQRSRTLTKIITRTTEHVHDVINAKKIRLPARSVPQPKRCRQLVKAIPPFMAKHSYLVTGTQINGEIQQVAETEEPNELVVATRATARAVSQAARKTTRAARIAGSAAGKAVRSAGGAVASTGRAIGRRISNLEILRDPALVIGDYVLVGWN